MTSTNAPDDTPIATDRRIAVEAQFQDEVMLRSQTGDRGVRGRFYFINEEAYRQYTGLLTGLQGKRVLVVGCSDGGVTPLARQGAFVEGIDISPVSIDALQAAIRKEGLERHASAAVMNAEDLSYPDASIDVISCSGVLHHLNTERALKSWARCVKDDGSVVLFEPLALHPVAALFRWLTPGLRTPDEHPLRGRDFALMHKYFGRSQESYYGLTTVVCAAVAVLPGGAKISQRLLPFFEALDRLLLAGLPFLRHWCWLTVVRLEAPRRSAC